MEPARLGLVGFFASAPHRFRLSKVPDFLPKATSAKFMIFGSRELAFGSICPICQALGEWPVFAHCRRRGFRPTDGYDLTGRAGCVRPNPIFFAIADLCAE
jgi:hypothetical protein